MKSCRWTLLAVINNSIFEPRRLVVGGVLKTIGIQVLSVSESYRLRDIKNLHSFFSLSLPRISSIIFSCSRQMDRRIVPIGRDWTCKLRRWCAFWPGQKGGQTLPGPPCSKPAGIPCSEGWNDFYDDNHKD